MVKEDGGSVCQVDMAKPAFKHFCALLLALNLPVSGHCNAKYGIEDIASMLTYMSLRRITFNAAATLRKKGPTSQWALGMLKAPSIEKTEKECKKMLERMVYATLCSGMLPKICMIAIDEHLIPFTGDRKAAGYNVVGGKPKGGTSFFLTMLTAQVVSGAFTPTVAVERVMGNRDAVACMDGIFSTVSRLRLRPKVYLLDRGFFGVRYMKLMAEYGASYVMPVVRHKGMKKAIDQFKGGLREGISKYTLKSQHGEITFYLVIVKRMRIVRGKRQWVYLAFATNVPRHRIQAVLGDIPETYRKRWGIENGYKAMERIRPLTCSRDFGVRLLLFYLAVMGCNFWYLANATAKKRAERAGMPPEEVAKIHTVLKKFMKLVVKVASKILTMERAEARRYLDGGG